MRTLVIDASTKISYVAVYNGNNKVDENLRVSNNDHSKYLINVVKTLLEDNNLTTNDINEVIVGVGPGSYTGVRVAVTIAKMFSYIKDITIKSISSLILLSSGYKELITPTIDARRGQVFTTIYHGNNLLLEEGLYLKDDLAANDYFSKSLVFELDENTINVNVNNVLSHLKIEENPHLVEPNYLRKTEAERNYDKKS